jgi:2-hydroxychromene-2-carboxylate isomerase
MRAVLAAQEKGKLIEFSRAAFESYWGALKDVSQRDVVAEIARSADLDPEWILARAESDEIKARLRANTDELIARGGFGSPTLFIDRDDMYFGNDRLPLVEAALVHLR